MNQAADILVKEFEQFRPSVVHAASDHRNALPALIAARKMGLPFIYEVRGLWEFTTSSKRINWEATERFEVVSQLEGICAMAADAVLTLTPFMRDELVTRGVDPRRIALAPNCVSIEKFKPRPINHGLRAELGFSHDEFIIGYAGSIVEYEGLDDLILAIDSERDA